MFETIAILFREQEFKPTKEEKVYGVSKASTFA